MNPLEQKHKIIVATQLICICALILFWAGYYLLPLIWENVPTFYSDYPNALPLPDLLAGLVLSGSVFLILARRKTGHWLSYLSGFLLVTLGVVGFRFPLEENLVLISMVTMMKSGFINLWCVVFGLYSLLKLRERSKEKNTRTS